MSLSHSLDNLHLANKRLSKKDSLLWGAAAQSIARERLGWIDSPERSRELLPALDALSAWARRSNVTRVVLSGMGGSSLAPEVIAAVNNRELTLLDSTHPIDVRKALDPDPTETIFVISSKSGETIETLSHLKAIVERIERAKLKLSDHVVIITDPGSPLEGWAREHEVRLFAGDPQVGGRFSALSIFGLLPSALLGIDCAELLDDAADMKAALSAHITEETGSANPAIALARYIMEHRPFLPLPAEPLSDWIEQLVAESTGKDGVGIIPIIADHDGEHLSPEIAQAMQKDALGGSFYLWEWTTALLGYVLGVNPFDQPNVASAKEATRRALLEELPVNESAISDGTHAKAEIHRLIAQARLGEGGYLALLPFAPLHDALSQNTLKEFRDTLTGLLTNKVTLGFGPRYLHSTGQCHKGGPNIGMFLVLTIDSADDYPIPEERYSFAKLISAQAQGDVAALKAAGREVLHLHLSWSEVKKLSQALREAS
jgi:glucose-6-phosphate isomerase